MHFGNCIVLYSILTLFIFIINNQLINTIFPGPIHRHTLFPPNMIIKNQMIERQILAFEGLGFIISVQATFLLLSYSFCLVRSLRKNLD